MAVHPLPSLTLEQAIDPTSHHLQGHVSQHGVSFFIPHPKYLVRNTFTFARRMIRKVEQAFMPFPWQGVLAIIAGATFYVVRQPSSSAIRSGRFATLLWNIDSRMPFVSRLPTQYRVAYLSFNAGFAVMVAFTFFHRMFLRLLLSYTGWMDAGRGPKPLKTVIWGALLRYIYTRGGKNSMLAYQTSLPALPLPDVQDTVTRYLESMEPILPADEFAQLQQMAQRFETHEAPKLQRYLKLKRLTSVNYISDWWLDFVYLRGRDSIMINSNFYGLSVAAKPMSTRQASRAAYMIHTYLRLRAEVELEKMPPTMIQNLVPICMDQYTRIFSLTRIPNREQDRLVKYEWNQSRHVVVQHKGKYYKLRCYSEATGKLLSPLQLEAAIEGILDDPELASEGEQKLGALTAWNRTKWAETRDEFFLMNKANRVALETIESAVFFVSLDTEFAEDDFDFTKQGRLYMHGNGCDRWFDKSFCLMVGGNGYVAVNGEHSFADAPALGHILDCFVAREINEQPYDDTGRLKPDAKFAERIARNKGKLYNAERIHFLISRPLLERIREAAHSAQLQIDDLDLRVTQFKAFGKGVIKKAKCSPDAFIQMALQLAFFRDQGKFVQTYESAMTRLYRNGRTETIRSCSAESCAFVRAMEAGKSKEECIELLRTACEKHVQTSSDAMRGKGVDRHLFGLYVVSVGTNTDSPFLKAVMGRGWKLSTSQVPQRQSLDWKVKDDGDRYPRPSGGFGPVADDGYGVSYVISGETSFFFHVSSKKSCHTTDSQRMTQAIFTALHDMAEIFGLDNKK